MTKEVSIVRTDSKGPHFKTIELQHTVNKCYAKLGLSEKLQLTYRFLELYCHNITAGSSEGERLATWFQLEKKENTIIIILQDIKTPTSVELAFTFKNNSIC